MTAEKEGETFKGFSFLGKTFPVSSEKESYDIEEPRLSFGGEYEYK